MSAKDKARYQDALTGIFEQFPLAVVITDLDRRVLWVNRAFTDLCGYEEDEVLGQVPGDLLQGQDSDPEVIAEMSRAIRARRSCQVELINYRKDGSPYVVSIQLQPILDERGEVKVFFAVEREITREREIEDGRNAYLLTLYDRLCQALDCPSPEQESRSMN